MLSRPIFGQLKLKKILYLTSYLIVVNFEEYVTMHIEAVQPLVELSQSTNGGVLIDD